MFDDEYRDDEDDVPSMGHRRRTIDPGDLDITPMIDVTFLLLIFFMVTSTMKEPVTADVPPARNGVGADMSDALVVTMSRPNNEGETVVGLPDGTRQTLAELRETDALTTLIKEAMNEQPPRSRVIINADRDLPHGKVRAVSEMVGAVEGARLFLGVQDK